MGREALRRCHILERPRDPNADTIRDDVPPRTERMAQVATPSSRRSRSISSRIDDRPPRRIDPRKHAQIFPVSPLVLHEQALALQGKALAIRADVRDLKRTPRSITGSHRHRTATAWWESPIAVGLMLLVAPPVGLAAVWGSRRYDRDARIALSMATGLFLMMATIMLVTLAR